jgi:hypothetical protein
LDEFDELNEQKFVSIRSIREIRARECWLFPKRGLSSH